MIRDDYREREIPARSPELTRPVTSVREAIAPGERNSYSLRDRDYLLNDSEKALLTITGTFRVVRTEDILRHVYGGDRARFEKEIRHLAEAKLVQFSDRYEKGKTPRFKHYIALSKAGKDLTDKNLKGSLSQVIYAGFKKPRELEHDAQLYRMFKEKEAELRSRGATPKRVVLDYEFKKKINSRMAKVRKGTEGYRHAQARVAAENGLRVTNGKIVIPDIRVEYETELGDLAHCDLEYVSDHYKAGQIAEKRAAGFSLYVGATGGRQARNTDFMEGLISL